MAFPTGQPVNTVYTDPTTGKTWRLAYAAPDAWVSDEQANGNQYWAVVDNTMVAPNNAWGADGDFAVISNTTGAQYKTYTRRAGAWVATSVSGGGVPSATTTVQGIVELATAGETITGTDAVRAVTPASLQAKTATAGRLGIVELATGGETATGTDNTRAITPAALSARNASYTNTGLVELATQAEVDTGLDLTRPVTPALLRYLTANSFTSRGLASSMGLGDGKKTYSVAHVGNTNAPTAGEVPNPFNGDTAIVTDTTADTFAVWTRQAGVWVTTSGAGGGAAAQYLKTLVPYTTAGAAISEFTISITAGKLYRLTLLCEATGNSDPGGVSFLTFSGDVSLITYSSYPQSVSPSIRVTSKTGGGLGNIGYLTTGPTGYISIGYNVISSSGLPFVIEGTFLASTTITVTPTLTYNPAQILGIAGVQLILEEV